MTVSVTTTVQQYTGTGANTVLNTVFPFFVSSDIVVTQRVTATGVDTQMVLGTHYTVSGGSAAGATGTVTPKKGSTDFTTAMTWTIRRSLPLTQGLDYVENDSFPAASHESGLDRLTLQSQDRSAIIDRSLRFPEADSTALISELPSAVARASKVLAFDSAGSPIASPMDDQSLLTVLTAGSTTARSHAERWGEVFNVRDYGAKGDGAIDDAAAIQRAIDAVPAGGGVVYLPRGSYRIDSQITITRSETVLAGDGQTTTDILCNSATNHGIQVGDGGVTNCQGVVLKHFRIRPTVQPASSGAMIFLNGGSGAAFSVAKTQIYNVDIFQPWIGIDMYNSNIGDYRWIYIQQTNVNGVGIRVRNDLGEQETNSLFEHIFMNAAKTAPALGPDYGFHLQGPLAAVVLNNCSVVNHGVGVGLEGGPSTAASTCWLNNCFLDQNADANFRSQPAAGLTTQWVRVTNCWLSGFGTGLAESEGVWLGGGGGVVRGFEFQNCHILLNGRHGILINAGVSDVAVDNCQIAGNGWQTTNTFHGIVYAAGLTKMRVRNSQVGTYAGVTGDQAQGIAITAGGGDEIIITGNDLQGNVTGSISNGATGLNQQIFGNLPDSTTVNQLRINGTDAQDTITHHLSATQALDVPSVPANGYVVAGTIGVGGVVLGDTVCLGIPNSALTGSWAGITYTAWVSAADVVTIQAMNHTGGALDPTGLHTFRVDVWRHRA